eukprot:PITA_33158
MTEGLILGHYVSAAGIQVDPAKIQILLLIPTPTTQTEAFKELKKFVSTAPVLRGPNWNLPFQISSDASDTAIGAVLGQEEDKKPYAIYYISKNLSSIELNYTIIEKEFLAEFDITIKDRPGKENPVANFLSRILKSIEIAVVEDQFPDEHLFAIAVRTPWYADVANYLAVGKLPKHLTPQERKQIVRKSTRFSWIGGHLFHTGVDMQIRRELITDGGPQFVGNKLAATLNNCHVQHKITTPYHPQANGQIESSNKVIESILTKTIVSHRRDWVARLPEALWTYRTTWRSTTGYSPYQLVFGKQPIFPIEFEIQTLRTAQEVGLNLSEAQINRLQQINELDEIRLSALQNTALIQQQRAKWHDALIKNKVFHEGDWALLYDSRFQDFRGNSRLDG